MVDACSFPGCDGCVDIDGYEPKLHGPILCVKHEPKCKSCRGPVFIDVCPRCEVGRWRRRVAALAEERGDLTIKQWNDLYPPGTPVRFWSGARTGDGYLSNTKSIALALPSGDSVVQVKGFAGCIALTHVEVVK